MGSDHETRSSVVVAAGESGTTASSRPPRAQTSTSILVVDQDIVFADVTARLLARRGGRVDVAASVEEAVELASEQLFDVAVVDLAAGAESEAFVAQLHAQGCMPRRLIFCLDEEPAPVSGKRPLAQQLGLLSDVLTKPYAFDQLVTAVYGRRNGRRRTRSGIFPKK